MEKFVRLRLSGRIGVLHRNASDCIDGVELSDGEIVIITPDGYNTDGLSQEQLEQMFNRSKK